MGTWKSLFSKRPTKQVTVERYMKDVARISKQADELHTKATALYYNTGGHNNDK